jgi:hypothetical protein
VRTADIFVALSLSSFSKNLPEYYKIEPEMLLPCFSFCFYDRCHYTASGVDQIPLNLIQARREVLISDIPVRNK